MSTLTPPTGSVSSGNGSLNIVNTTSNSVTYELSYTNTTGVGTYIHLFADTGVVGSAQGDANRITTVYVPPGQTITRQQTTSAVNPNTTTTFEYLVTQGNLADGTKFGSNWSAGIPLESGKLVNTTISIPPTTITPIPAPFPPAPSAPARQPVVIFPADPGYRGVGGSGAGGTAAGRNQFAGGGGGVGVFGEAASGQSYFDRQKSVYPGDQNGTSGGGGSRSDGRPAVSKDGNLYGGGGGGGDTSTNVAGGVGAQGVARIVWGRNRNFPQANTRRIEQFPSRRNLPPTIINYDIPGEYLFEVPEGVTSLNALAIGAGGGANTGNVNTFYANAGGGGGALGYANNIQVTPGEIITIVVGEGGASYTSTNISDQTIAGTGGSSRVSRGSTNLLVAGGGGGGRSGWTQTQSVTFLGGAGGTASGTLLTAGFSGGKGGDATSPGGEWGGSGGGGAAGYLGNGGAGASAGAGGRPGLAAIVNSGAGGGGGSGAGSRDGGGGGGGVGLPGLARVGSGTLTRTLGSGGGGAIGTGGSGGSGGSRGNFNNAIGGSHVGGDYGGGAGGGGDASGNRAFITRGAHGAVQIAFGGVDPYPGTGAPNIIPLN